MISYTQIQNIAADVDFVATLLAGEKVPCTGYCAVKELVDELANARKSLVAASEILNWLPVEVVDRIPNHFQV